MALTVAVVAFFVVAMTALVVGGLRDRRRRRLRDEVARQAAFARILFARLPVDASPTVDELPGEGRWRVYDDGQAIRVVVPPDAGPAGPPDVVQLPPDRPREVRLPDQRGPGGPARTPHLSSTQPVRSPVPPV